MKLLGVLLLCAFVAAVPTAIQKVDIGLDIPEEALASPGSRNILINTLIRQLINYIRHLINNGSSIFGFPPLDPLVLKDYHLYLPLGLINLDLELKNAVMTGIGSFVVHTSNFVPSQLSFELDISVPSIEITAVYRAVLVSQNVDPHNISVESPSSPSVAWHYAEWTPFSLYLQHYDLIGDLLTAIPLYGKGSARFQVDEFRFRGTVLLKQSDDGRSVLIDRVVNSSYQIPNFKCELTGVIGGGNIDKVVNAIVEDVIIDYANRFQGVIAALVSQLLPAVANPVLDQLDTWKYIDRFV